MRRSFSSSPSSPSKSSCGRLFKSCIKFFNYMGFWYLYTENPGLIIPSPRAFFGVSYRNKPAGRRAFKRINDLSY